MLLKEHKGKPAKIKYFKYSERFVIFVTLLVLISFSFGFSFKEGVLLAPLKPNNEIRVKVNYREGPNQEDFFTEDEIGHFIRLGGFEKLGGDWTGTYDLVQESVFWINPEIEKAKVLDIIKFGPYNIALKFNLVEEKRLSNIQIIQEEVRYDPAIVQIVKDEQINYWTKARSKYWLEIVRGKIFRKDKNELLTVFQTTVYENKVPIYAFRGQAILNKKR